jgi:hypothetical protein
MGNRSVTGGVGEWANWGDEWPERETGPGSIFTGKFWYKKNIGFSIIVKKLS